MSGNLNQCYYSGPIEFCDTNAGGGGSGGSLTILAKELTVGPNARLKANGGDGGEPYNTVLPIFEPGYAGGGGRVKVYYESGIVSPSATIEARAGIDPHEPEEVFGYWAEDGTVYAKQVPSIENLLVPSGDVDNNGVVDRQDLFHVMSQWGDTEPSPTPTATPTHVPTKTPTPTRTPFPTHTPKPTPAQ